jgi:hypothetical protein
MVQCHDHLIITGIVSKPAQCILLQILLGNLTLPDIRIIKAGPPFFLVILVMQAVLIAPILAIMRIIGRNEDRDMGEIENPFFREKAVFI